MADKDLISRQALRDVVWKSKERNRHNQITAKAIHAAEHDAFLRMIDNAPSIEVEEVRHGRWVFGEMDVLGAPVHCSECGWGSDCADPVKWAEYPGHRCCGSCGAKMDLEVDHGKA